MYQLMHRMINAKYSIPAWEWVLLTFFMAFAITFLSFTQPEVLENVTAVLPFDGMVWGPLMMASSGAAMIGMAHNLYHVIRHSAFVCFLGMVFLDISWWISSDDGYLSVLVFCSWITLFWLYKYLASFARERDQV